MCAKVSEDDVIQFFRDFLSISIKREDLIKPTKSMVIDIYSRFLEEFGYKSLDQPDLMAIRDATNPEYMMGCVPLFNMLNVLTKLGIEDINLLDIIQPKRNRTFRIISVLCTLYTKFIKIKNDWSSIEEHYSGIRDQKKELEVKLLDRKHKIEEKQMLLDSLRPKSIEQDKELDSLKETLHAKQKQVERISQQFQKTKEEILQFNTETCDLDIKISEAKERNKQLKESIVKSPQKAIANTKELELELETLEKDSLSKKQQLAAIKKKIACYDSLFNALQASNKDIQDTFIVLHDSQTQCSNFQNIESVISTLQEENKNVDMLIKEKRTAIQNLKTKCDNMERNFSRNHENLSNIKAGLEEKVLKLEQELEKANEQLHIKRTAFEDKSNKLDQELEVKLQLVKQTCEKAWNKLGLS